ncbi:MAG: hypothetical protein HC794_01145 [Nitrospiraceae bacterium]|nr:hypothetical protein [Nitrospiraceae bacterium]
MSVRYYTDKSIPPVAPDVKFCLPTGERDAYEQLRKVAERFKLVTPHGFGYLHRILSGGFRAVIILAPCVNEADRGPVIEDIAWLRFVKNFTGSVLVIPPRTHAYDSLYPRMSEASEIDSLNQNGGK